MSIKIENLSYTYAPGSAYEIHALKNLNLEIEEGQFVGIIGHTGSGKSTLIQLLDGLIKADEGIRLAPIINKMKHISGGSSNFFRNFFFTACIIM